MADIVAHPWMTGEAATHEEFTARYDQVMQATRNSNANAMDIDFQIARAARARGAQRSSNDKFA